MKKLLLPKKSMLMLAVVAVLMAACGLKITSVEFSTREPEPNSQLTVKALFEANGDNNKADYYLTYAIRVPSDWTGVGVEVVDNSTTDVAAISMVPSEGYAAMCEYAYPREGYKWIAYQSKDPRQQGDKHEATMTLTVGEKVGEYDLAIMAGGWKKDPSELLKDGQLNVELAFGHNNDFNDANTDKNDGTGQPATCFHVSEYLFNVGTISNEEYAAREAVLKQQVLTLYGMTFPIVPDMANQITDMDMHVTVKGGAGIEGVKANEATAAAEYFDLQGRKVEVPVAGFYIVKRGDKVTKELVK